MAAARRSAAATARVRRRRAASTPGDPVAPEGRPDGPHEPLRFRVAHRAGAYAVSWRAMTALALPPEGRVFRHRDRVTLADVSPAGRARLDALARWLQDAAYDDSRDSGLDDSGVWIVRRLALRVLRFPRLDDTIEVATFCSGAAALVGGAQQPRVVRRRAGRRGRRAVGAPAAGRPAPAAAPRRLRRDLRAVGGGPARARAAAPSGAAARGRAGAAVALPRRRPRPRRPRQQRRLLGGARGRARRARAGGGPGGRDRAPRSRRARARRRCSPTARSAGSWTRTARSWRR